jgi:hypothetical protein
MAALYDPPSMGSTMDTGRVTLADAPAFTCSAHRGLPHSSPGSLAPDFLAQGGPHSIDDRLRAVLCQTGKPVPHLLDLFREVACPVHDFSDDPDWIAGPI